MTKRYQSVHDAIAKTLKSCQTHDQVFVCVRWLERLQKATVLADNQVKVFKKTLLQKRAEIAQRWRQEMDQNKYQQQ